MREDNIDFRELVEWLPAVVYVAAPGVDSSALYVSSRVESMLGYARDEWLSEPGLWAKLLHPEDRGRALAEAVRARGAGEAFRIEYRLIAKGGRVVWVRDEAAPVLDEEGSPKYWRGVLLDITERREAEEKLRGARSVSGPPSRRRSAAWRISLPTTGGSGSTASSARFSATSGRNSLR